MSSLAALLWPLARAGEAVEALAHQSRLARAQATPPSVEQASEVEVAAWLEGAANRLGLEAEPIQTTFAEAEQMVRRAAPALLLLPLADGGTGLLALWKRTGATVAVVGPELSLHRLPARQVAEALRQPLAAPLLAQTDELLAAAGVPPRRRAQARTTLLRERLGARPIQGGWLLRLSPGASAWAQAHHAGLHRDLAAMAALHALQYGLWLLSWAIIGRGALAGRVEGGWLAAWGLLLLSLVPLRLRVTELQGWISLVAGGLLKRRLLYGALRLEPDQIRAQGSGQLLGRVMESEAVETLALSGGLSSLVALIELGVVFWLLLRGAGGALHALLLVGWLLLSGAVALRYWERRRRWTLARLAMTHDLVEQMVGHRTRLAQELPSRWHVDEDRATAHALALGGEMDQTASWMLGGIGRGWLLVGMAAIVPAFIAGQSPTALALAVGGTLLAHQALRKLAGGMLSLSGAGIAWQQVAPLFAAASRPQPPGVPALALVAPPAGSPLLHGHGLRFRYAGRGEAVLHDCHLRLYAGDRVLLEGPSGGGKSTLAALLLGLRQPEAGLLLVGGLDYHTLGAAGWRRWVAAAPQFHENHVFTETFAFNLLMGRRWPPEASDMEEAEALCHELGLGELLARMPAGMLQMVGESGWQLSHGERSRLYIARALLQGAEVLVLDESFAALDPTTLALALRCVLARARTLLVVAHP